MRPGPRTPAGRRSVLLLLGFAGGYAALMLSIASGQRGGDRPSDNWWLAGPALVAVACAIGALATGLFAITRRGERAPSVALAVLVGALVTLFVAGEVLVPH